MSMLPLNTTHLLFTNWLSRSITISCNVENDFEWINPYRPDLNINRVLSPYSSVNELQKIREQNSSYSLGNIGKFSFKLGSEQYGNACIECSQIDAYGVQSYDLTYGMYKIRHRTGLNFNIYEIMTRDNPNNCNWMELLVGRKPEVKVNEITIPGSHDSGMIINRFSFLKRLTENQYDDILGQLKSGIRYFDIRLTEKNGQFYTYHGNDYLAGIGISLNRVIADINAFMEHYGLKETIFLVVSKTRGEMKVNRRLELIKKLEKEIRNVRVYRDGQRELFVNERLGDLAGEVVVLYDCRDFIAYTEPVYKFEDMKKIPDNHKYFSDTVSIYDSYSNTNLIDNMISDQNNKLDLYGGYKKDYLFLYSFTLTVQPVFRLSPQLYWIELLGNISRARMPIQLEKMRIGAMKKPNIVYYDFVDAWSCSAIISLND